MAPMVRILTSNGRPAYLQEPMPTRGDPRFPYYPQTDRADYFLQAVANAKLAGAAAWCFHTSVASDMRDPSARIEDRLKEHPEVEGTFVDSLVPSRVNLQTNNGVNYLSADGGGGGDVRANSRTAGAWETFTISVFGGGPIVDGDRVVLGTSNGTHYLQAVGGGGAALRATGSSVGPWEVFVIEKSGGGGVRPGDEIRLRAPGAPWYVGADGGGGGAVNVNRPSAGPWETFRIVWQP
jgi:hypothetical protein